MRHLHELSDGRACRNCGRPVVERPDGWWHEPAVYGSELCGRIDWDEVARLLHTTPERARALPRAEVTARTRLTFADPR